MATKPAKRRVAGGRVTPRGTRPGAAQAASTGRYTPPTPASVRSSPTWVPVLMFSLMLIGALIIITNYVSLLPGATSNIYLLVGLAAIGGGIITATQYR